MQKKKSGVKKCLEILPLRGEGGVRRLMANAILNFHFDFLNTSLRVQIRRRQRLINVGQNVDVDTGVGLCWGLLVFLVILVKGRRP